MSNLFDGTQRRRVRLQQMAEELGVSGRTMSKLEAMGAPCTKLGGLTWFEPVLIHAWLDRYNRKGAPGIKRTRGAKIAEITKAITE
jgi:hypothetical protein